MHLKVRDEALLECLQMKGQLFKQDLVETIELEIWVDKHEAINRYVIRLEAANPFMIGEDWRILVILLVRNAHCSQQLNGHVFLDSKKASGVKLLELVGKSC